MSELPDIKIFHHGRPSNFEAAASTTNIVDIARWNAGHQQWKDQQWSRVIKIEGNEGLVSDPNPDPSPKPNPNLNPHEGNQSLVSAVLARGGD